MSTRQAALALAVVAAALAVPAKADDAAPQQVTLVCDAVYLPARTNWAREVRFVLDDTRIRRLEIDGVPVYTFAVFETVILTSLDNERIQLDTASLTWRSDFRGQATSQGHCERR
ncbi:MAG: hypothetical protein KF871_03480 [Hydrogenophaga sp.]|uniref:hypothetical protein n=1 Tax=Hydrogenophaga sp. TaxID=1904254 RepID=UPI001E0682C8|nr:hypothetical protein [Hydrogenophaga sp.]MBX3608933.1 hypothetical protein [Hydrogenophaga sp.]